MGYWSKDGSYVRDDNDHLTQAEVQRKEASKRVADINAKDEQRRQAQIQDWWNLSPEEREAQMQLREDIKREHGDIQALQNARRREDDNQAFWDKFNEEQRLKQVAKDKAAAEIEEQRLAWKMERNKKTPEEEAQEMEERARQQEERINQMAQRLEQRREEAARQKRAAFWKKQSVWNRFVAKVSGKQAKLDALWQTLDKTTDEMERETIMEDMTNLYPEVERAIGRGR